jgi:hypothetical protein
MILALVWVFVSLVAWEGVVNWTRYVPAGQDLGGFVLTAVGVKLREPGTRPGTGGPEVPADRFRGARYEVLEPVLLALVAGGKPRYRLTGILLVEEVDGEAKGPEVVAPWGGGQDPLGRFLEITKPLTFWLVGRRELVVRAPPMELGRELRLVDEKLVPGML